MGWWTSLWNEFSFTWFMFCIYALQIWFVQFLSVMHVVAWLIWRQLLLAPQCLLVQIWLQVICKFCLPLFVLSWVVDVIFQIWELSDLLLLQVLIRFCNYINVHEKQSWVLWLCCKPHLWTRIVLILSHLIVLIIWHVTCFNHIILWLVHQVLLSRIYLALLHPLLSNLV